MALALIIPLIHITIVVSNKDNIEDTFQDIEKFRSYYTDFVAMVEEDFGGNKYISYEAAVFEDEYIFEAKNNIDHENGNSNFIKGTGEKSPIFRNINVIKI